jgi:hypothetical protein
MRLWTIHPKYLDRQGLTALWREALLAQAVLNGETKGYRNHPQLERFKASKEPLWAIGAYLRHVFLEASCRGYNFDESRIGALSKAGRIAVTAGQVSYEWLHLLNKLSSRSPEIYKKWQEVENPDINPLFVSKPGEIEPWERPLIVEQRAH